MADLVSSVHIIATDETSTAYAAATANAQAHTDAVQAGADQFRRIRSEQEGLEASWIAALEENANRAVAAEQAKAKAIEDAAKAEAKALEDAKNTHEKFGEGIKNFIEHPLDSAASAIKGMVTELGPMGIVAAAAVSGVALVGKEIFGLVNEEGLAARETKNFATTLGVSFEEAKKLGEMAKIVDVNIGGLSRAAFKLAEALQNPEGKEGEALKKLGVTATEAGPALLQVLEKLSEITNATDRMAAAREVLGRAAVSMAPLIEDYNKLGEAVESLGGKLSGPAVKGLTDTRESVNELGIAWDHLKEQMAAQLAPTVNVVVKGATEFLTTQTAVGKIQNQMYEDLPKYLPGGSMSDKGSVTAAAINVSEMIAQSVAMATKKGLVLSLESASTAGAEHFKNTYGASVEGLKKKLEDLDKQHTELAKTLTNPEKFNTADTDKYAAQTKKIADVKQQLKEAEKSESGAGVSERNAAAEKMIEQDKARALQRVKLAEDTAEWMRATNQITEDQETAELVTAQNRRFQIEKDAAEKINALKVSTARAEHKPAEPGTDVALLATQNEEKILAINAKGAAEDKKDREKAFEDQQKISLELFNLDQKREEDQRKVWYGYYEDMIKEEQKQFQASEIRTSAGVAAAKSEADMQRMIVNAAYDAGNISLAERVKRLKEVEEAEYRVALMAAYQEAGAAVGDPVKTAQAEKKIQEITAAHNMAMEKINIDGAKKSEKPWMQYFQSLESNFNRSVNSMITGQEKFRKAAQSLWQGLVTDSAQALEKMIEKQVIMEAKKLLAHTAAKEGEVAVDTTAATESGAISGMSMIKEVAHAAAKAAANTWAAISSIPVVGPFLAPAAAAAALYGVYRLATMEEGGLSPRTQLTMIHAGESTYTQNQTTRIEKALGGNTTSNSSVNNHYHGYPGESPHSVTQNAAAWQRAHRDGRLRFA